MEVDDEIVNMAAPTGDRGYVDGNLTEEDVQEQFDGGVTFRDRSFGQEFVVNEKKMRAVNKHGIDTVDLTGDQLQ
jgi:hypothetical protein